MSNLNRLSSNKYGVSQIIDLPLENLEKGHIYIFTDGSSSPHATKTSAWGYLLINHQRKYYACSGHEFNSSNNRAEIQAVYYALKDVKEYERKYRRKIPKITLISDSGNAVFPFIKWNWIPKYKKQGLDRTKQNIDLWEVLIPLVISFGSRLEFMQIPGHGKCPDKSLAYYNNVADDICGAERKMADGERLFTIRNEIGDICEVFKEADDGILAQCISVDLACGITKDGRVLPCLATDINKHFNVRNTLLDVFNEDGPYSVGDVCTIQVDSDKYICNLFTKEFYYNKPSYDSLKSALGGLRNSVVAYDIKRVYIPYYLACGMDKLDWNEVFNIIQEKFRSLDVELIIVKKIK